MVTDIHAICDRFEAFSGVETRRRLEEAVSSVPATDQIGLLEWLVPIVQTRAWEDGAAGGEFKSLDHYVKLFPYLKSSENRRTFTSLVTAEFRIRQDVGDRPSIAAVTKRYPDLGKELLSGLRTSLMELSPTYVVFSFGENERFIGLETPLNIGRRKSSTEPGVGEIVEDDRGRRLIIADINETFVSRNHVDVELIARDQVSIRRNSPNSSVMVGATKLNNNDELNAVPPVSVLVGTCEIAIENRRYC